MSSIAKGIESFQHNNKFFIKFFLLDDSLNLNRWGVTQASILRRVSSFLGKPFIRRSDFGHTKARDGDDLLRKQDKDKVGTIIDVGIEDTTGKAFGIAEVDQETYNITKSGEARFVSPAIVFHDHDLITQGGKEVVTDWIGAHVALVKDPAFGIAKAQIKGTCAGTNQECLVRLQLVQANTVRIGTMLHFTASPCMEKCLHDKKEKGIPIDDQALAICLSECGESRQSSIDNKNTQTKTLGWEIKDEMLYFNDKLMAQVTNCGNVRLIDQANYNKCIEEGKTPTECAELYRSSLRTKNPANKSIMSSNSNVNAAQHECPEGKEWDEEKQDCVPKKSEMGTKEIDQANKRIQELEAKLTLSERKPLVERIVKAKTDLGKIKTEDSQKEFDRLVKLETETLTDMASEYENVVTAKKETKTVIQPRFAAVNAEDRKKGDELMITLGGRN